MVAGRCTALWGYFPQIPPQIRVLKVKGWHNDVCRRETGAVVVLGAIPREV